MRRPGRRLGRAQIGASLRPVLAPGGSPAALYEAGFWDLQGGVGDVTQWHDKVGAFHLVQAVVAQQPAVSSINGYQALRIVKANSDYIETTADAPAPDGVDQPWSACFVAQGLQQGIALAFSRSTSANPVHNWQHPSNAGTGKYRTFRRDDAAGATQPDISSTANADLTAAHVYSLVMTGTAFSAYVDGVVIANLNAAVCNTVNALTFNRFTLGAQNLGGAVSGFWDGLFGDIVIYNTAISAPVQAITEANLKARWRTP